MFIHNKEDNDNASSSAVKKIRTHAVGKEERFFHKTSQGCIHVEKNTRLSFGLKRPAKPQRFLPLLKNMYLTTHCLRLILNGCPLSTMRFTMMRSGLQLNTLPDATISCSPAQRTNVFSQLYPAFFVRFISWYRSTEILNWMEQRKVT